MGFSHRSYLPVSVVGGLNFYIFLLSLSAYINKPELFTNTLPCFQKFDKSPFFSFHRYSERRKRVVHSLSWLSENPREITLSAAAVQQRVITNSNGCFYINGRLWRPLNEQIAGVKHLWKCHLWKRKGGRGGERGEERKSGRREGFFDPGRYLQGSAEQLSISDQWFSFQSWLFKALFGFPGLDVGSLNKLATGQHPCYCMLINVCHVWKTGICDESWIEIERQRTQEEEESRVYRGIKYWKWNKRRRQHKSRRKGEEKDEGLVLNKARDLAKEKWRREAKKERLKQGRRGWKESKAGDKQTQGGRGRWKCCSSISAKQQESSGALNLAPIRGLMMVWSEQLKRAGAF